MLIFLLSIFVFSVFGDEPGTCPNPANGCLDPQTKQVIKDVVAKLKEPCNQLIAQRKAKIEETKGRLKHLLDKFHSKEELDQQLKELQESIRTGTDPDAKSIKDIETILANEIKDIQAPFLEKRANLSQATDQVNKWRTQVSGAKKIWSVYRWNQ